MDSKELYAFRVVFFLTIKQASKHVGFVSESVWKRWEKGTCEIPNDVVTRIFTVIDFRKKSIESLHQTACRNDGSSFTLPYFIEFSDFIKSNPEGRFIDWCIQRSIYSELAFNTESEFILT